MTDAAGKETTWKQAFGSVALVLLLLGALGAFLWFLIREISRLDSNVAAASIGATATVLVSAIAVFSGRYLERKKELEAAARENEFPVRRLHHLLVPTAICRPNGGGTTHFRRADEGEGRFHSRFDRVGIGRGHSEVERS